jgi:hypothetical protein
VEQNQALLRRAKARTPASLAQAMGEALGRTTSQDRRFKQHGPSHYLLTR